MIYDVQGFFAIKYITASRLQARDRFIHPPVMCQLDFWTQMNELFMFFRRYKCSIAA